MRRLNPMSPIVYDRNFWELQESIIFCIVVAGKNAKTQMRQLRKFLISEKQLPFDQIEEMIKEGILKDKIQESGLGQHTRLEKCFTELVNSDLDLYTCKVEELEAVHGIGPKTARFFLSNNRKDARVAMLDTHILRFMREELQINAPKSTPSGKLYQELEQQYLAFADSVQRHPSELDLAIWKSYSLKNPGILYDFVFLKKNHNLATV